jgi:hypothetical protein
MNGIISGVTANNNYDGILLDDASTQHVSTIAVYKSVASNNQYTGFYCAGAANIPASNVFMTLQNVTANNNQYGIKGDEAGAFIRITNSVSVDNSLIDAYAFDFAVILSYGNNILGTTNGVVQRSLN